PAAGHRRRLDDDGHAGSWLLGRWVDRDIWRVVRDDRTAAHFQPYDGGIADEDAGLGLVACGFAFRHEHAVDDDRYCSHWSVLLVCGLKSRGATFCNTKLSFVPWLEFEQLLGVENVPVAIKLNSPVVDGQECTWLLVGEGDLREIAD